jgi:Fic family protein
MTIEKSHPWITFRVDLRELSYKDWLMLGEAQSKCEHLAGVPLLPSIRKTLHQVYLQKGALATTAIEGNTLTEEEVAKLVSGKLRLPPSKEYLGQEVTNILDACNQILDGVVKEKLGPLRVADIKEYNRLVLRGLTTDEETAPGEIRGHSVVVGNYRGAPAEACEALLERLAEWLESEALRAGPENRVAFGIIRAILAHLYLAWIHPFGDGNGRTARLMELHLLMESGVPSAAAQLLSNHYNQTRSQYYRELDAASRSGGDVIPFIRYALQGFLDGLREQIEFVKMQQVKVHLINYIYDAFRGKERVVDRRRRTLALELSNELEPVAISDVRHITPRIAELYAGLSDKTLQRDIGELEDKQLIVRNEKDVRAHIELMLAMRPPVRR